MLSFRYNYRKAHGTSSSGLGRSQLLVLMAVLALLVAVGYVPVSNYLEKARINRAMESAHTISTLLSQYATDNNGVYPVGEGTPAVGKSEGIARNLLENNYLPDASVFAVGSTEKYGGSATDFSDIAASNLSWDFTAGANATTGITAAEPDLLPVLYTTGENATYTPAPGARLDLAVSGTGPFGSKGVVVAYKGNNAVFIPGAPAGEAGKSPEGLSFSLQGTGTYTQIKP